MTDNTTPMQPWFAINLHNERAAMDELGALLRARRYWADRDPEIVGQVDAAVKRLFSCGTPSQTAEALGNAFFDEASCDGQPQTTPQDVTVPHAALEHDRQVVTALRQRVADLEALVTARITAPDAVVAKVWELLPKTSISWEDIDTSGSPPLWFYEIMDEALALLPIPAPAPASKTDLEIAKRLAYARHKAAMSSIGHPGDPDAETYWKWLVGNHPGDAVAFLSGLLEARTTPVAQPDDLEIAKRIAWALVWNGNVRFKTHDELWNRLVDLDLTEQYMRAASAARGEG